MNGAVDHHDAARGHRRQRSVVAAEDLVDVGVVDDADAQDIRRGAELPDGRVRRPRR